MKGLVGLIGIFVIVSIPPPTFGVPTVQCAQIGAYSSPYEWKGSPRGPQAIGAKRFFGRYSGAIYSAFYGLANPALVFQHNDVRLSSNNSVLNLIITANWRLFLILIFKYYHVHCRLHPKNQTVLTYGTSRVYDASNSVMKRTKLPKWGSMRFSKQTKLERSAL